MQNTNTTLYQAAQLLQSYGWQAGKVQPVTTASEKDWIESRERAYRLADYNDARAARQAGIEAARMAAHLPQPTGSSSRMPKPKTRKVVPGTGTSTMFDV